MKITNLPLNHPATLQQPGSQTQKNQGSHDTVDQQSTIAPKHTDSVRLSAESHQLAHSSNQQGVATVNPITNQQEAKSVAAKVAADIKNHPNAALNAHSNVGSLNYASLQG